METRAQGYGVGTLREGEGSPCKFRFTRVVSPYIVQSNIARGAVDE